MWHSIIIVEVRYRIIILGLAMSLFIRVRWKWRHNDDVMKGQFGSHIITTQMSGVFIYFFWDKLAIVVVILKADYSYTYIYVYKVIQTRDFILSVIDGK